VLISIGVGVLLFLNQNKQLTQPEAQKIRSSTGGVASYTNIPSPDHVVIIMMENKSKNAILGSREAPYINSLIQKYSLAGNYFAITHPSLPNYIALIGGSTFNITSDCTDCFIASPNFIDQLEEYHKTWKTYMESMPSSCFLGNDGTYAQKHNPFIYFDDIRNNPDRCRNIIPYTELEKDFKSIATTPNFAWISPNLCHDMHDCSIAQGDSWLSREVPLILTSPAFKQQQSLLIITWDEGEESGSNQIPTLFIGDMVKPGFVTQAHYTHYSLLHTIESLWKMPPLTVNVANSALITDILLKGN